MDGLVTYDVFDNERRKAIAELKKMPNGYPEYASAPFAKWYFELCEALGVETGFGNVRDRLIHLLGGDQPSGIDLLRAMDGESDDDGTCPSDDTTSSITGELCEWIREHTNSPKGFYEFNNWDVAILHGIADNIDARFNWAMISRSSELGCCKLRINQLESERDELHAKLDEYDRTHVELPRDKNGEVFRVDGGARVNDLVLTIRQMILTKDGWKIRAYDENYEVEREASFFDACAPKPDPIEETIEKLTLGEITQSEAIERIKSLGQE